MRPFKIKVLSDFAWLFGGIGMSTQLFVVITVDTEDSQRPAVVYDNKVEELDTMVYGYINGNLYGFTKIIEICDGFGCKATFFVSVFDCGKYGEDAIAAICRLIKQRGHDIQLHTHPRRVYDKARREMYKYSFEEQVRIVKDGAGLIRKWVDESPVAHRAGAYGLNEDTIKSLRENNIRIDSSMFYGYPNCKLTWSRNRVVERDGILEIPVTGFFREKAVYLMGIPVWRRRSFVKTDIDAASLDELKFFAEEARRHDIRVMNLFMHSYSFIRFNADFTHFEPDYEDIEKFERFLEYATADPSIRFVTIRELFEIYQKDPGSLLDGSDYVPIRRYQVNIADKIKRRFLSRVSKKC